MVTGVQSAVGTLSAAFNFVSFTFLDGCDDGGRSGVGEPVRVAGVSLPRVIRWSMVVVSVRILLMILLAFELWNVVIQK